MGPLCGRWAGSRRPRAFRFDHFRHSGDTIRNIVIVFNFISGISRLFGGMCVFVLYKKMHELAKCRVY